jgi:hypothetical protein
MGSDAAWRRTGVSRYLTSDGRTHVAVGENDVVVPRAVGTGNRGAVVGMGNGMLSPLPSPLYRLPSTVYRLL